MSNKRFLKFFSDVSKCPETGKCGVGFSVPDIKFMQSFRVSDGFTYLSSRVRCYTGLRTTGQRVQGFSPIHFLLCNQLRIPRGRLYLSVLLELLWLMTSLRFQGLETCLAWVPAHVGIVGNQDVDKVSKVAFIFSF